MKRIMLFATILVICGCSGSKNKDLVEKYLQDNEPYIGSLEIIEVSDIDSCRSSYLQLISMPTVITQIQLDMSNSEMKYLKTGDKNYLNKALQLYDKKYLEIDSTLEECCKNIDYPEEGNFNRQYIKAKYRINGQLKEELFYLDSGKKEIGHTKTDEQKAALNAIEASTKIKRYYSQLKGEI